jgi:hypothetical protein
MLVVQSFKIEVDTTLQHKDVYNIKIKKLDDAYSSHYVNACWDFTMHNIFTRNVLLCKHLGEQALWNFHKRWNLIKKKLI